MAGFILFAGASSQAAKINARVLVLSSYHIGFGGTDPMVEGIKTAFANSNIQADFYLEYLDTKRFPSKALFPVVAQLYEKKFSQYPFDVILVADNNAFDFIRKIRDRIFPGVPVVFCGINNFDRAMLDGFSKVTGVAEDISLKETVELALSLHPGTRHLAVVSDSTTTGQANLQKFKEIEPELPESLNVINLGGLSAGELVQRLEALPEDTVMLQLSFYMDREGKNFSQEAQMDMICRHSRCPIYSAWDFFIAHGVLGGVVTYFPLQGETAGNMAVKILNGTPVDEIPVITSSPNIPLFDYPILKRFQLTLSDLPQGHVVLNVPKTFYHENKGLVWAVILFALLQSAAIGALVQAVRRFRRTQQRLKQYERIVSATSDLMSFMDKEYRYQAVNDAYLNAYGKTADQILGKTVAELLGETFFKETLKDNFDRCIAGEQLSFFTWVYFEAIGRRYVEVNYFPYQEGAEGFSGLVASIRDMTENLKLEEQLRHTQKLEAIGTLAGGIAHDFNNILVPVLGYAELLWEDIPQESHLREDVAEILTGAKRARELVKQILTFSRQEDEREIAPLQPQLIIKEVVKLMSATLPSYIEIKSDIDSGCRMILADPTQVHQIAMNLITNAFHAMEETGGQIYIVLKNIDGEDVPEQMPVKTGPCILLSVKDNGMGMAPEVAEKIFDPYYTTKSKDKGTGLGLSVVFGIIQHYGGKIEVTSEPGKGSVFNVYLPAIDAATTRGDETEAFPDMGGNERILLVDDEATVLRLEQEILSRLGYRVEAVESGEEALERFFLMPDAYDLVITDMTMPKFTGDILVQKIKAVNPGLPVIICSGFSEKLTPETVSDLDAAAILIKPIIKSRLAETVRKVLDGRS